MTRTVFYGFGAFVGTIDSPTSCGWWPDDPQNLGWSPKALIPVDLAKNPTAARLNQIPIADIQVDDHRIDGGLTSVGPRWPGGASIGQIWLAETFYKSLGNQPPRHPPGAAGDAHDYELTSILYWDGDLAGRRFNGYHARIVGTQGPLTRVELWHGGTARRGGPPAGAWWLDLAAVAHPVDPIATQIAVGKQPEGPLFLDTQTARGMVLYATKRPPGWGHELLP